MGWGWVGAKPAKVASRTLTLLSNIPQAIVTLHMLLHTELATSHWDNITHTELATLHWDGILYTEIAYRILDKLPLPPKKHTADYTLHKTRSAHPKPKKGSQWQHWEVTFWDPVGTTLSSLWYFGVILGSLRPCWWLFRASYLCLMSFPNKGVMHHFNPIRAT